MEGNRVLMSLFGIISLSSLASSMVIFPFQSGEHVSSYGPIWPRHFGRFLGGWRDDHFPSYRRHYRMRDTFHPFQLQQQHPGFHPIFHESYSSHSPRPRPGYFSVRRSQQMRRINMPIFSRRPTFIGSRISSFPRRIRIPLNGSPIIDGWSRISGLGAGTQGLLQGLATERRGVDTPSFPVVPSSPISVPHAIVAWVGGDDDERTKISINQQVGTIPSADALAMQRHETVAAATMVTPIGKTAGKLAGASDAGKIVKAIAGAAAGKGIGAVGIGKKGIKHGGKIGHKKIVPTTGIKAGKVIHPTLHKVKGVHSDKTILPVKSAGVGIATGAVVGGSAVIGKSAALVEESLTVAKVGDESGVAITDGLASGVDGKAKAGIDKINLKIKDADSVKINIGNDNGKKIKEAPAVKGDKSGDIVITGKVTTDVKKVVEPVATKLVAAKASTVVGKVSGAVKEKIILPKKDIIVPVKKIVAEPVIGPKIVPSKQIVEKVIPVKKDLVPHKAPIVKL